MMVMQMIVIRVVASIILLFRVWNSDLERGVFSSVCLSLR